MTRAPIRPVPLAHGTDCAYLGGMRVLTPIALFVLTISACAEQAQPEARPIAEANGAAAPATPPPSESPGAASGVAAPNELLLSGSIEAGDGVSVPSGATLFLMGREKEKRGPPVLVKKFHPVNFPLEFSLTGADQMMQGRPVPNEFHLSARLDQDGDAISKTPGDLTGTVEVVTRGAKDVKLVLSGTVSEAKPSAPVQTP